MKLKEIIVRRVFLFPLLAALFVPFLALLGLSCFFELLYNFFENCANWLNSGVWIFRDWVLVVTGIEERESVDEL